MAISPLAEKITVALIQKFEGLELEPYLCPAGVPTIGYGSTFYEDGTPVTLRDPAITEERARELLLHHVYQVYLPALMKLCPHIDTAPRLAALLDFTYNLGEANLRVSTLRKRINEGRWDDVPGELRKWVIGGGRVLRGLVRRREQEAALVSWRRT